MAKEGKNQVRWERNPEYAESYWIMWTKWPFEKSWKGRSTKLLEWISKGFGLKCFAEDNYGKQSISIKMRKHEMKEGGENKRK